jgi:CheY-like chemotaxis protein
MTSLTGKRILVVEDELLIAMVIEAVLADEACEVVGPIGRLDAALQAAEAEMLDAALLDVNVEGEVVFPVADILARRGIPFAFVTGYGSGRVPAPYRDRPVLTKPYRSREVIDMLKNLGL